MNRKSVIALGMAAGLLAGKQAGGAGIPTIEFNPAEGVIEEMIRDLPVGHQLVIGRQSTRLVVITVDLAGQVNEMVLVYEDRNLSHRTWIQGDFSQGWLAVLRGERE